MPPELEPLLRAVLADPAADAPRLEYAARLARSSRPAERARAEFIELQIDLAQRPDADPEWPSLVARERDLLERFRAAWERPLRDLFRPSLSTPGRWLRAHMFGSGGRWGFRRGFVEHVLAPAPTFFAEDAAILGYTPVRRLVLSHASAQIGALAAEPRLDHLASLHLVGDMELDEDLNLLAEGARAAGLTVLEFRLPRLWPGVDDLFEALRSLNDSSPRANDVFPAWRQANPDGRRRLSELSGSRAAELLIHDPAHEGELLALNEWVYLGDALTEAGVWAVAKSHQDLEDDEGRCRRLVLLRSGQSAALRESPYCQGILE